MTRLFHTIILAVTLLWVCAPQGMDAHNTQEARSKIQAANTGSSIAAVLLSFGAKPGTCVNQPARGILIDPPPSRITRSFFQCESERDYTSFIVSHHLYTQTVTSDL